MINAVCIHVLRPVHTVQLKILKYLQSFYMEEHILAPPQWSCLHVAAVQYPLVGGMTSQGLLNKVRGYVDTASSAGAQLVVLPELFISDMLDFSKPEAPQFYAIAEEIYPKFIDELSKLATEKGVYVLAGSFPAIHAETKNIRNRAYLISPNVPAVYQEKLFLTGDEVKWGWEAADTLNVIQAPWGKTVISICYDSEFPLISQTISEHSVDLILVPSMTSQSGFTRVRWSSQARAIEHMAYVVVTGTTGAPAAGWEMTAQGVVLGPSLPGFLPIIAEGEMNANGAIVHAVLDMTLLREAKATGRYYPAGDQRGKSIQQTLSVIS